MSPSNGREYYGDQNILVTINCVKQPLMCQTAPITHCGCTHINTTSMKASPTHELNFFIHLQVSKSHSKTDKMWMGAHTEISRHQKNRLSHCPVFDRLQHIKCVKACIVAYLLHLHDFIPHRWPAFALYATTGLAASGRVKYYSTSCEIFCNFETEAISLRSQKP